MKWAAGAFLLTLFVALWINASIGQRTLLRTLPGFSERVLVGDLKSASYYLEIFPESEGYLYGRSAPNPGGLLPWDPVPVAKMISILEGRNSEEVVGSSPGPFWAYMHADFGPFGLVAGLFIGVIIYVVFWWTSILPRVPLNLALITSLAFEIASIAMSSAFKFFFPIPLLVILLIWFIATHSSQISRGKLVESLDHGSSPV